MKKLIYLITVLCCTMLLTSFTNKKNTTAFCLGWEDGYCEGWRDVKGQLSICPVTPVCPIPKINEDRYRDGYNRAFKAGSKAAK